MIREPNMDMGGPKAPEKSENAESNLNQIFMILNTNVREGQQMMCQRNGDTLSFYTLFASEQAAQSAYDQLVQLEHRPRLEDQKVFLTVQFPGDEIDKLAATFNSIPKRKN